MSAVTKSAADWVSNARTNILAWWIPKGVIIAALFAPVPLRAAVWTVALVRQHGDLRRERAHVATEVRQSAVGLPDFFRCRLSLAYSGCL